MPEQGGVTLSEAATQFLATRSAEEKQQGQLELSKFVRWCGADKIVSQITVRDVATYSESVNAVSSDAATKLEPVKSLLSYMKKHGLINESLAPHVRAVKLKRTLSSSQRKRASAAGHALTKDGHAKLKSELETLKNERSKIVDQIKQAAADKDFRENAPLDAAKDQQGHVEGRIRQIEATLTAAVLIENDGQNAVKVTIGSRVVVTDLSSGQQLKYNLVSPSEASPSHGKLSVASPMGKALLEQKAGTEVEVVAPIGKLKYRIEQIES